MMRSLGRWGVFLGIWLLAGAAWGGFPHLMSFQGRLDDATGIPLPNGDYTVTFRLYDDPTLGPTLWEETQVVTTSAGIFAVLLGTVDTVPSYMFFLDSLYLEIQPQGSDPVLPRTRLTMVPYAWHARDADFVGGASALELEESLEIDSKITTHAANAGIHHQKTVSASELVIGTLSESLLPQGAIDSSEIEVASIPSNRLSDGPGVAHAFKQVKDLSATISVIDSADVTVPASGYLLVMANGWFYMNKFAATAATFATVSLTTTRNQIDENHSAKFSVLAASPAGHTNENFTVSRVIPVSAGQTKVFLTGYIVGIPGPQVQSVHINTIFVPTAYGNVVLMAE